MANIPELVKELRTERDQLDRAIDVLSKLDGRGSTQSRTAGRAARTLSPAARRRIAAAQRVRWAKFKAAKNQSPSSTPRPRIVSAAARRKMAAAQKARWAKSRAQQAKKAA